MDGVSRARHVLETPSSEETKDTKEANRDNIKTWVSLGGGLVPGLMIMYIY